MKAIELIAQEVALTPDADMVDEPIPLNVIETLAVSGSPEIDNEPPPD